ncbi:MAG: sortase [Dehalococcoidia bacterium]|nr:sortase [Dehalococcoidia bacterium]
MSLRHRFRQRGTLLLNIAAIAAAVGVLVTTLWGGEGRPWDLGGISRGTAAGVCCDFPPVDRASLAPVERLVIPAIEVDAPVMEMGVDAANQMEIPDRPDVVAWYGFTALPGTAGNAVFAAHVNWHDGARAVFEDLDALHVGDEVRLVREDGAELRYRVTSLESVDALEGAADSVVADTPGETLTFITCHGAYDPGLRQYVERLVVRAVRWP